MSQTAELLKKLDIFSARRAELGEMLSSPDAVRDQEKFKAWGKEYSDLEAPVAAYESYTRTLTELEGAKEMLSEADDKELKDMAREEVAELEKKRDAFVDEIRVLLLPKDPHDEKNVILEIRAGTGGEEAALFARQIFRLYNRFAERQGWKLSVVDVNETGLGGIKSVEAIIEGKGAYSRLKYETGTHRVQRVPATESSGRVHTSAVTVAMLPEAEAIEIEIHAKDLRIDTYCASGKGGQSVNTAYSAVRITHLPTNTVVQCQDERSQLQNRENCMRVLRSRLLEKKQEEADRERTETRRSQIGSGDRSEKIRTYNFSQNRVTDHRVGVSVHSLENVLDGEIDAFITALIAKDRADALLADS